MDLFSCLLAQEVLGVSGEESGINIQTPGHSWNHCWNLLQ